MSRNQSRIQAIAKIADRAPKLCAMPRPLSEIWASDVFDLATMEEALSKKCVQGDQKKRLKLALL